ncbi:MAG: hypothetical protein FJ098_16840, partial [Deltaproteobacteria bacterium]|nr:hypothetical protein [Deltaproteobacteria bacterium]
ALFATAIFLLVERWPRDDTRGFREAAARIDERIRPGELVILHPPGNAWHVAFFDRHTVIAPQKLDPADVEKAAGLWFVTDRGDQRVRQVFGRAMARFRRMGTAQFHDVTVFHLWEPRGDSP